MTAHAGNSAHLGPRGEEPKDEVSFIRLSDSEEMKEINTILLTLVDRIHGLEAQTAELREALSRAGIQLSTDK